MSQLRVAKDDHNLLQNDLSRDSKRLIRLDLFSQIPEPLIFQDKVIGLLELKRLAAVIDQSIPMRGRVTDNDLMLLKISTMLEVGDLGIFSREMQLHPKIFQKYPKVERTITKLFGAIEKIADQLATIADFDQRLLKAEPEYLLAISQELQRRNKEYGAKSISNSAAPNNNACYCISQLSAALEKGDLRHAIVIRLCEGDKMRGKGQLTEYIENIFGTGFRLERAWAKLDT